MTFGYDCRSVMFRRTWKRRICVATMALTIATRYTETIDTASNSVIVASYGVKGEVSPCSRPTCGRMHLGKLSSEAIRWRANGRIGRLNKFRSRLPNRRTRAVFSRSEAGDSLPITTTLTSVTSGQTGETKSSRKG